MKVSFLVALFCCLAFMPPGRRARKVFDVHLHGSGGPAAQLAEGKRAGVYRVALSTSWQEQEAYRKMEGYQLLYGLMFPCPQGKVPYSGQACFADSAAWPTADWVEEQVRAGRIDFLGEVLAQYYGISSSDTLLYPYYAIAERYGLPVGVHTGGAGPGHGSPSFQWELGDPALLAPALARFPRLKLWIMHGGDQYHASAIALMRAHPQVYADLSVLSNPAIVKAERFAAVVKDFIDAGLGDRLLFGTDNGDIHAVIAAVEGLPFLTRAQKEKIYYRNAERFFARR